MRPALLRVLLDGARQRLHRFRDFRRQRADFRFYDGSNRFAFALVRRALGLELFASRAGVVSALGGERFQSQAHVIGFNLL